MAWRPYIVAADKVHPVANQGLAAGVGGMSLAGENELNGPGGVGQEPSQPLWIVQQ